MSCCPKSERPATAVVKRQKLDRRAINQQWQLEPVHCVCVFIVIICIIHVTNVTIIIKYCMCVFVLSATLLTVAAALSVELTRGCEALTSARAWPRGCIYIYIYIYIYI